MNEELEKIFELPEQHKIAILVGTLVLLIGGYWFLFYSPVSEEVSNLRETIDGGEGIRVQIAQEQGVADNLDEFVSQVKKLDIELEKALRQLPDKKEIHALLAKISDQASDAGLEIRLFKPQTETKRDFYAEVPVEIEVHGTYHQVATLFDEVGHLDRIVNLKNFSMSEPYANDDRITLRTSVVATTFRFLDESERPKPKEAAGGKRRRRSRQKS